MSCRSEDSRISAWVDGELGELEAFETARHVAECPSCRSVAASFSDWKGLLAREVDPDPGFLVRFRERREQMSVAPFWTWRQLALRLLPLAAAVLVAALWSALFTSREELDLRALEREALGSPTAFVSVEAVEPVLSIALDPFPWEEP